MAYVIGDSCVRCGECERYCPVEAIAERGGDYVIDASACISCGTCFDLCPARAISPLPPQANAK
jgi:MinD superfamily P-loop ATPase